MSRHDDEIEINPVKIGVLVIGAIFVLSMFIGTWFKVDQGDRTVVLTNGAVSSVVGPGIHFKAPFFQTTQEFSVRTQRASYKNVETYSKDLQVAHVSMTVNYSLRASKIGDIYTQLGVEYKDRVVTPAVLSAMKTVFGQYNATESIDDRAKLVKDVSASIAAQLKQYNIRVENVAIEDISFSKQYNDSVEARMKAQVDVEKAQQNLDQEKIQADIVRTNAQGAADALVEQAKAKAQAVKLQGEAEASAIKAKGDALRQNPDIIQYTVATQWNGTLPTTMLPNGSLPMLKLPSLGK